PGGRAFGICSDRRRRRDLSHRNLCLRQPASLCRESVRRDDASIWTGALLDRLAVSLHVAKTAFTSGARQAGTAHLLGRRVVRVLVEIRRHEEPTSLDGVLCLLLCSRDP